MDIYRKDGLFYIGDEDNPTAFIKYTLEEGVLNLNSTFVGESLRGGGIAGKLMAKAIDYAREEGLLIRPICSYAVKYFERHPEDRDVEFQSNQD
ncbi:MAG: GNAT family N-acetyltransferase [Tissierellia bacterium]|nr:GNAT family N-acetyltransferase [Tissierellia bacterium]